MMVSKLNKFVLLRNKGCCKGKRGAHCSMIKYEDEDGRASNGDVVSIGDFITFKLQK